jgi:imidazole glycerol-phosphate synthase subunit HisH
MAPARPPIQVVDYHGGNAPSVVNALEHLGLAGELASRPEQIERAERIVLPGVGAAGATMDSLRDAGLLEPIERKVRREGVPFLGICIGLQILFEHSEEDDARCFGWIPGKVKRFTAPELRVPQIGWNEVRLARPHPVVEGLPQSGHYYFVNSYYAKPADPGVTLGWTRYGDEFTSLVVDKNVVGAQFHVEKSGPLGLRLLRNFAGWRC